MNFRNRIALVCIAIPALAEIGLGLVYLVATEIMPYHKEAIGSNWSDLDPGVRALFLTFMNGYGSTHLAVGIALSALLMFPLRHGQAWARWVILAVGLPVLAATAFLSARLAAITGANVPWMGALALLVIFLIGVVLVGPGRNTERLDKFR